MRKQANKLFSHDWNTLTSSNEESLILSNPSKQTSTYCQGSTTYRLVVCCEGTFTFPVTCLALQAARRPAVMRRERWRSMLHHSSLRTPSRPQWGRATILVKWKAVKLYTNHIYINHCLDRVRIQSQPSSDLECLATRLVRTRPSSSRCALHDPRGEAAAHNQYIIYCILRH